MALLAAVAAGLVSTERRLDTAGKVLVDVDDEMFQPSNSHRVTPLVATYEFDTIALLRAPSRFWRARVRDITAVMTIYGCSGILPNH